MALSAHSLRVSWNKPRYVGGILGWFTVSIRPYIQGSGTKPEWRHVANVNADSGSHWISGLEPDTRYEVTVRGYVLPNDEGQGGGYNEYALPKIGLTWPSVPGVPANFQRSEPASGPRQTTAKPNGDTANITAYVTAKEANPEEPSVTHAAKTHANSSVEIKPYARNFTDVRAATAANEHDQGGEIGQLRATKPMTTNETGDANANTRLSSGATAGIVIACLVAVAVVVTAIVLTVRKAQKKFIIDADVYYNGIVNE
uniref:Fibronectin type-III domain-containing protein n=1 Tax=Mesocestoides corti TaxID=53468 RepID=A0A5K3F8V7_MESCO